MRRKKGGKAENCFRRWRFSTWWICPISLSPCLSVYSHTPPLTHAHTSSLWSAVFGLMFCGRHNGLLRVESTSLNFFVTHCDRVNACVCVCVPWTKGFMCSFFFFFCTFLPGEKTHSLPRMEYRRCHIHLHSLQSRCKKGQVVLNSRYNNK